MGRLLLPLSFLMAGAFAMVVRSQEPPKVGEAKAVPSVQLKLGQRTAIADAHRKGLAHNSAPLIDVVQPQPNVMIVTMTGLCAVAGVPCEVSVDEITFDLLQTVNVVTARPGQRVKLSLEAQLAGLLRGNREGAGVASTTPAEAVVHAGQTPILGAAIPGRTHTGRDLMLISLRTPRHDAIVTPGEYCLVQKFAISCSHPKKCFHKNVMTAAFGNETARAPDWMQLLDPSREIPRQRDFGFRVILQADPVP